MTSPSDGGGATIVFFPLPDFFSDFWNLLTTHIDAKAKETPTTKELACREGGGMFCDASEVTAWAQ